MRGSVGMLLLGLVVLGATSPGRAVEPPPVDQPFDLRADELEYERERDLYVARGHVRIEQEGRLLTADWVTFSNATRVGVASGDVVLRDGEDVLRADLIQFDVDSLTGVVLRGRLDVESTPFRMEAEEVQRRSERRYRFERGRFTTCRCAKPGRDPWAIRAREADVEVGGSGRARDVTFEVLGVPVFWLPWAWIPLRTERQTGFLIPGVGATSRSGGDFELPFFWAARPNLNVVLTPAYVTDRGFKSNAALEYVFGERSEGTLAGSFIRDQAIDRDDPSTAFSESRWGGRWVHDQFLPGGWRFKTDARLASDNLYAFDFPDLREARWDRALESTGFVEHRFGRAGRLGFAGGVQLADDLQAPDDLDRDAVLLQRLPSIDVHLLADRARGLPFLTRSASLRYTYYRPKDRPEDAYPTATLGPEGLFLDTGIDGLPSARERDAAGAFGSPDGSQDDSPLGTENDGLFQEGEPLADRGHRLVVAPRIGAPVRLGGVVELLPEVGYHGTFYSSDRLGAEQRHLLTGRLDARARLRGRLALPLGGPVVDHVLEPRLGWALVSKTDQRENPLFVPATAVPQQRLRQAELDNLTLDPADRLPRANIVVMGIGNRFFATAAEGPASRLLAEATLSAAYDFAEKDWGLLLLEGAALPLPGARSRFLVGYDLDAGRLSEAALRTTWHHHAGHELALGYRYLREIPEFFETYPFDSERFDEFEADFDRVNQLDARARLALPGRFALTYRLLYSIEESLLFRHGGAIEYVSACHCWAAGVEVSDDRSGGVDVRFRYTLLGLGDARTRVFGTGGNDPLAP